ncbi:hypothetical protein [Halorubrum sp. Atlit-26R]|uniref:hypothetical protein n=1 Tax=Halorubrum sp. Atlit-26R TaxID=2282128 RepID=UPI0011C40D8E|nr:hypothetical protein [Halorubrum sp. Atlit-26R]
MNCQENIRAESNEALAHVTIAHYADNHYEQYLELPMATDTRGTPEVLKDRSIITHPIAVHDK